MAGRGQLRVYLGAAAGVGKTYRMLEEGHRRRDRGTDVAVGFVECHGRRYTEALVEGLPVTPRRTISYRGASFTEMDLDAVLSRRPQVALVDELAHTNVPGSSHAKRWQDIQALLDAGITVITTVNIQHLESLNDVVAQITGLPQRETVPDSVVRQADQIELVDMTPEALRRRMVHGNIYGPEKVVAALGHYFRVGNLTALRELALLWVADKVDEELDRYRAEHHITRTWETRERVVVALTGGSEGETLIRRAARIAARTKGADLLAVHVARNDGLAGADPAHLARQRALLESLGGTYHQVIGGDVPTALLDFARGVNATQLVLGASRRGRAAQIFAPGVGVTTTAGSGSIDVHLVTHEQVNRGRRAVTLTRGLTRARRIAGFAVTALGLPLLTVVLTQFRGALTLPSDFLLYLGAVVAVALVGGLYPALAAALAGFALLNWYFVPPFHQWTIVDRENILALVVFLAVATAVSTVVDLSARRTSEAARARAQAETLSTLAGSVLRGSRPLPALLDQVRETFGLTGVTLLERRPDTPSGPDLQHDPAAWRVAAAVGEQPCLTPAEGDADVPVDDDLRLVLHGHPLPAADRRVIEACAAQAAVALRQERLEERAAAVGPLAEVDRLRTALLRSVSHDLRSPLASAKAAVDSLRGDIEFSDEDRRELLDTAEDSLARLGRLVENLLDMSRLQAGALAMAPQLISLAEAVPRAVDDLGEAGRNVRIQISDDLPDINADPALLERALANLLTNALRYSAPGEPPLITASEHLDRVEVRVVDRGPGVPATEWDRIFLPFQRLGDCDNATGVGLGLALARGLIEAMGGTLTPEATPGGGLTMAIGLPVAEPTDAGLDQAADPAILNRLDHWRIGPNRQDEPEGQGAQADVRIEPTPGGATS
ncbi:MAG: two-component system, OmpR family, sensor histidine kinase KdpD [Actinomycetota bacterium]|jgi:two-component system sensor histidine kinase KdpD|nr:two-component system, OmpR family, sensor histidine kinase KdpD [Actinomycetota bacterium]